MLHCSVLSQTDRFCQRTISAFWITFRYTQRKIMQRIVMFRSMQCTNEGKVSQLNTVLHIQKQNIEIKEKFTATVHVHKC